MTEEKRHFYVAEFGDHSISVLPGSWIYKDSTGINCYWHSSVSKIKSYEIPNPRWKVCPILRIVARKGKYCNLQVSHI
jgi:hypothetical protein